MARNKTCTRATITPNRLISKLRPLITTFSGCVLKSQLLLHGTWITHNERNFSPPSSQRGRRGAGRRHNSSAARATGFCRPSAPQPASPLPSPRPSTPRTLTGPPLPTLRLCPPAFPDPADAYRTFTLSSSMFFPTPLPHPQPSSPSFLPSLYPFESLFSFFC